MKVKYWLVGSYTHEKQFYFITDPDYTEAETLQALRELYNHNDFFILYPTTILEEEVEEDVQG